MLSEEQKSLCMDAREVSKATGFCLPRTYELMNRSDFPSIRFGKRIIVPRAAFEAWLMDTVANGRAVIDKESNYGRR